MEIDNFNAMNESLYHTVMNTVENIMLIIALFAIVGFVVYLAGAAWLCFAERRQTTHRQMKPVMAPPEPDEFDLLAFSVARPAAPETAGRKAYRRAHL